MYDFIYPEDIDVKLQNIGKTSTEDKMKLFFFVLGLANAIGVFTIPPLLRGIGINMFFSILIQIIVNGFIFLTIGRFLVFDEKAKLKEYNSYSDDSLGRYYKIREENTKEVTLNNGDTVKLLGYDDGSYLCALRIRYGSNGNDKIDYTFSAFKEMFLLLGKNKIECKDLTSKENFRETEECEKYLKKLNNIEDNRLSAHMMQIMDTALTIAEQESNVAVTHILMRFKDYQSYDAGNILSRLLDIADNKRNGFRSVKFVDFREVINLVREYYGLEVVDLAMLKIAEPTAEELQDILRIIQVGYVSTSDGKVFRPKGVEIGPVSLAKDTNRDK